MIALQNISVRFSEKFLFQNASLHIGTRDRISIVGPNGAGKTTLMKIIAGRVTPESGRVIKSRDTTTGYLPQDGVHHAGRTLLDEALSAFADIKELETKAERVRRELEEQARTRAADDPLLIELAHDLGEIQHHLEHRRAWEIETRTKQVLAGLGFSEGDTARDTTEFSGGWQMRIALAKLLLLEPRVLLLDEPTNHLDLESLEWLETELKNYDGALILVSHDRRFLDNIVSRLYEIDARKVTEYAGNYSYYETEKAMRQRQVEAQFANQQRTIKETERFIERFRYKATKARQVQSRIRMLEKMDRIELESDAGNIRFRFPSPPRPGKVLLTLEQVSKKYGDLEVLQNVDFQIDRGDRIAFVGVNGAGKSTLARIIAGTEPVTSGRRATGHNLVIAYYAQHQADDLDPDATPLEALERSSKEETRAQLRTLLGGFLFQGDDVFKKIRVLSGGERSRVALAKMMLSSANLLVMDEPSNHLDIRSKSVLQEALLAYEGSYIIVSHDRDFLQPLVNKVAELANGGIRVYPGSFEDYLEKKRRERQAADSTIEDEHAGEIRRSQREKERKREEARKRNERYRKLKPLRDDLARVENRIEELEALKARLEESLADEVVYKDAERARELNRSYKETAQTLTGLYEEWARLQEGIDAIEREEAER